jgi:hypothetical protein
VKKAIMTPNIFSPVDPDLPKQMSDFTKQYMETITKIPRNNRKNALNAAAESSVVVVVAVVVVLVVAATVGATVGATVVEDIYIYIIHL